MSVSDVSKTRDFISFPDGDTLLRSNDGVEFRVDFVILRRASGVFHDMASFPHTPDSPVKEEPIQMVEASDVLDTLLRLIYPIRDVPSSVDVEQGEAFLRAVDRLQISTHMVDRMIDGYLASLEALRAWALAVRFNRVEARRDAVRRFILHGNKGETTDFVDWESTSGPPIANLLRILHDGMEGGVNDIVELESISARALSTLQRIKRETLRAIIGELAELIWCCPNHLFATWYRKHMGKILLSPFDSTQYSDDTLLKILQENEHCATCFQRFNGNKATRQRMLLRAAVSNLVSAAVLKECPGADS